MRFARCRIVAAIPEPSDRVTQASVDVVVMDVYLVVSTFVITGSLLLSL